MISPSLLKQLGSSVGVFAIPLALAIVFRATMSPLPASAQASPQPPALPVLDAKVSPKLTDAQQRAIQETARLRAIVPTDSPFLHPAVALNPTRQPAVATQPSDPLASLVLSGVIGGSAAADNKPEGRNTAKGTGIAMINSTPYTVGDEPVPGWRITRIQARAQRVELTDSTGQTRTLTIPRPITH